LSSKNDNKMTVFLPNPPKYKPVMLLFSLYTRPYTILNGHKDRIRGKLKELPQEKAFFTGNPVRKTGNIRHAPQQNRAGLNLRIRRPSRKIIFKP
jgi:hypothetical protein